MANRMIEGYLLYLSGNVEVIEYDPDHNYFEFKVESESKEDMAYQCVISDDEVLCDDPDFRNRGNKEINFICKHLAGSFFKLSELLNGCHECKDHAHACGDHFCLRVEDEELKEELKELSSVTLEAKKFYAAIKTGSAKPFMNGVYTPHWCPRIAEIMKGQVG